MDRPVRNVANRAYLDISGELLVQIMTGLKDGDRPREFKIKENGLPSDVELEAWEMLDCGTIRLSLRSVEFAAEEILSPVWLESTNG